ncbi:MAG TPA: hypothetical protein VK808_12225 [Bacteroidia bacterium]|jgi:hypothetical protein|nr:hypothetical protein [Bacteroidia bacterium]
MEYLELKVLPESPTVIMNDKDEVIGNISVNGVGEVQKNRTKHIAKAINSYELLIDALMMIHLELDNGGADKAKELACDAYYKATKEVRYG